MEKIKMTLQVDENRNSASVLLEGEIDIDSVGNIVQEIGALTDKYSAIHFDIKNVTKLDLSGIQFFYAVEKKMKNSGKKNTFVFELDTKYEDLVETTGFSELLKSKN